MPDPLDKARHERNVQQERARKAEAQRDALVSDLRAEVERPRKPKAAEFPDFEGGWASCEEDQADSLQQIIDRYSGGAPA